MMIFARRPLLIVFCALLLAGCPLFRDPASPPFSDRIEAVQSLSEYGIVVREDWSEMRVVNNGVREFLILDAPVEDGRRLLVLNSNLSLADTSVDTGGIREAFPVGYGAGFVVGRQLFDENGVRVEGPDPVFNGNQLDSGEAAVGNTNEIVRVRVDEGSSVLTIGPRYTSGDDYSDPDPDPTVPFTIRLVDGPEEGDPPEPEFGFRLRAFSNPPASANSEVRLGLVLENSGSFWAGSLSFSDVSQLFSTPVGDEAALTIGSETYSSLLSVPTFSSMDSPDRSDEFTITPNEVISLGRDRHEIFSRSNGELIATRVVPRDEYFLYAYSPTGRHMYMLDRVRWRVYRVSAWW
ncbi:MAG: hypothetical protein EA383_17180 [Spirochaetaceae bacterium]|nr:MAG: hypothetical protein EA383_17180 [Spirochaetaceae bacterium]